MFSSLSRDYEVWDLEWFCKITTCITNAHMISITVFKTDIFWRDEETFKMKLEDLIFGHCKLINYV